MPDRTIEQFEDELGLPIVLLTGVNPVTKLPEVLTVRDLPVTGVLVVLRWLNQHRPTDARVS
jgi:hypothetical protein